MIAILTAFALLLGGVSLATNIVLKRQADDAVVVNLAGRQRMLSQKMTKEAAQLVNASREQGSEAKFATQREQLQNTLRVFETTLISLRDGGPAPLNLEMTRMRTLPPASTPEIKKQLETVTAVWEPFKKSMNDLIHSNGSDAVAGRAIMDQNLALMDQMNTAVNLMQADSEQKVNVLFVVQTTALGLGLVLVVVGGWMARSTIAKPLIELARAAHSMSTGNLNVELNLSGTQEVKELGASFDRMRASMVAALGGGMGSTNLDDDDL
ncbi:MAG TPA: type IV pili methyl-accepting chemotaxis transducer N-terminal domain-containing protein [Polyangiaceae bacterium]|nr:type IV pili methyl-accepting chemotaxis transducer N-terminal domain-containing protein [Polyangiaceae bacterium]